MSQHLNNPSQRLDVVDALRGFALLGILLVHINHWYAAGPLPDMAHQIKSMAPADTVRPFVFTEFFNSCFITSKFYPLFTSIFGFSFYLQKVGFWKKSLSIELHFLRRALVLFLFGFLHQLLWMGDILMVYAILMVPLLFLRRLNTRMLFLVGIVLLFNIPGLLYEFYQISQGVRHNLEEEKLAMNFFYVISEGKLSDIVYFDYYILAGKVKYQILTGRLFLTLGFFMMGIVAGRKRWIQQLINSKTKVYYIFVGAFLGLIALQVLSNYLNYDDMTTSKHEVIIGNLIMVFQTIGSVAFYSTFIIVFSRIAALGSLFGAIATLGRMALTAYVMQTAIGLLLFYHIGFGLFMKTSQMMNIAMGVGIYAVQLVLAQVWFKYFNYGPMEWLLRGGTFLSFQPLLKAKSK